MYPSASRLLPRQNISALSARSPEVHPLLTTLLCVGTRLQHLQSPVFLIGCLLYGAEWPFRRGLVILSNDRVRRPKPCSMFFSYNHEMDQCLRNAECHRLKEEWVGLAQPWEEAIGGRSPKAPCTLLSYSTPPHWPYQGDPVLATCPFVKRDSGVCFLGCSYWSLRSLCTEQCMTL